MFDNGNVQDGDKNTQRRSALYYPFPSSSNIGYMCAWMLQASASRGTFLTKRLWSLFLMFSSWMETFLPLLPTVLRRTFSAGAGAAGWGWGWGWDTLRPCSGVLGADLPCCPPANSHNVW